MENRDPQTAFRMRSKVGKEEFMQDLHPFEA